MNKYGSIILLLTLSVISMHAEEFEPGKTYWGTGRYVEFIAGNSPVIISVPHDGAEKPDIIPDRTFGTMVRDRYASDIALEISSLIFKRTGRYPFIIICRLSRKKLDANREEFEGAQDNPAALKTWEEYHAFIDTAKNAAVRKFGKAFYVDLHGHNNPVERIELGYRFDNDDLKQSDSVLNTREYIEKSSLQNFLPAGKFNHAGLIRGKESIGALLDTYHVPSTPSPSQPQPESIVFFSGGYSTNRHAVEGAKEVSGLQIELNTEMRKQSTIASTASVLTDVLLEFLENHWGEGILK